MGGRREQVGSITRSWNADNSSYSTNIYFNDPNLDVKRKSLFVGAAFLLVSCRMGLDARITSILIVSLSTGVHVFPRTKLLLLKRYTEAINGEDNRYPPTNLPLQ